MKSLGKQIPITVYTLSELKQLYEEAKNNNSSSSHAFINSHINFDINKVKDDAKLYDDLSYSIQDIEEDILDCIWDKINCISMDLYELNKELLKPSDEILIEYAAGKYFSTQLKPYFMEES